MPISVPWSEPLYQATLLAGHALTQVEIMLAPNQFEHQPSTSVMAQMPFWRSQRQCVVLGSRLMVSLHPEGFCVECVEVDGGYWVDVNPARAFALIEAQLRDTLTAPVQIERLVAHPYLFHVQEEAIHRHVYVYPLYAADELGRSFFPEAEEATDWAELASLASEKAWHAKIDIYIISQHAATKSLWIKSACAHWMQTLQARGACIHVFKESIDEQGCMLEPVVSWQFANI